MEKEVVARFQSEVAESFRSEDVADFRNEVVARFLRYAVIDTESDENSGTHPSSEKELVLARLLVSELQEMGAVCGDADAPAADGVSAASDAPAVPAVYSFDEEHGYIYCVIPENVQGRPAIGFIAHMDTAPEASGANVVPKIIENYDGGEIVLGSGSNSAFEGETSAEGAAQSAFREDQIVLRPSEFPELLRYKGQTLITASGTTLLGSDDKSGVAEIMTMAHYFLTHPEVPHGRIGMAFTPDEEIGEGTLFFDIEKFGVDYAYTVDGGELGELSYENFNAASATVTVTGRNVHPGEAYGKMIHASRLAMEIEAKLPSSEKPDLTRDREGFFHLTDMCGDASEAVLKYIIRDHDAVLFAKKKETMEKVCAEVEAAHPGARVKVEIRDTYFNMLEKIRPRFEIVERCADAMRRCGVEPRIEPVRGGTDGAMLSYRGLLCPNICAGGHNFHGVYEYVSCESMEKIVEILIEIAKG